MDARQSGILVRLHDILDEINGVRNETTGLRFETFEEVWLLRRGCERAIEIISEASRHLPDELKSTEPSVAWRQIAGNGNVLRHNYENISVPVMWDIITNHLDPLEQAVRRLLTKIETDEKAL